MKKTFLLPCWFICIFAWPSWSQTNLIDKVFPGGENNLVLKAVDSALVVVRIEYVLVDSAGNEYGTPDTYYYGFEHQLGCLSAEGILLPATALSPWKRDKEYEPSDSLTPKLFKVYYRYNNSRRYEQLEAFYVDSLNEQCIVLKGQGAFPQLPVWSGEFPKDGWVFSYYPKNADINAQDSLEFRIEIAQQNIAVVPNTTPQYLKLSKPANPQSPIGSVLFACKPMLGQINFSVVGLVSRKGAEWGAYYPTKIKQAKKAAKKTVVEPIKPPEKVEEAPKNTPPKGKKNNSNQKDN